MGPIEIVYDEQRDGDKSLDPCFNCRFAPDPPKPPEVSKEIAKMLDDHIFRRQESLPKVSADGGLP